MIRPVLKQHQSQGGFAQVKSSKSPIQASLMEFQSFSQECDTVTCSPFLWNMLVKHSSSLQPHKTENSRSPWKQNPSFCLQIKPGSLSVYIPQKKNIILQLREILCLRHRLLPPKLGSSWALSCSHLSSCFPHI